MQKQPNLTISDRDRDLLSQIGPVVDLTAYRAMPVLHPSHVANFVSSFAFPRFEDGWRERYGADRVCASHMSVALAINRAKELLSKRVEEEGRLRNVIRVIDNNQTGCRLRLTLYFLAIDFYLDRYDDFQDEDTFVKETMDVFANKQVDTVPARRFKRILDWLIRLVGDWAARRYRHECRYLMEPEYRSLGDESFAVHPPVDAFSIKTKTGFIHLSRYLQEADEYSVLWLDGDGFRETREIGDVSGFWERPGYLGVVFGETTICAHEDSAYRNAEFAQAA